MAKKSGLDPEAAAILEDIDRGSPLPLMSEERARLAGCLLAALWAAGAPSTFSDNAWEAQVKGQVERAVRAADLLLAELQKDRPA